MRDEVLRAEETDDELEHSVEVSLRPRTLAEFVGQRELKEHLEIILEAGTKIRNGDSLRRREDIREG